MILKLGALLLWSFYSFANLNVLSPQNGIVTASSTIELIAAGTVNRGFLFIQDQMYPIRKHMQDVPIRLEIGQNLIHLHILDENQQLQYDLTQTISVYRTLPIQDNATSFEAMLLTDLTQGFNLNLLDQGNASMDAPILKKDAYAFLMWFYLDQSPKPLTFRYSDMTMYSNYLSLYEHQLQVLPEPRLSCFYPEAYVTLQDIVQLLLRLDGQYHGLSESYLLTEQFSVPVQYQSIIPATINRQHHLMTRRQTLTILSRYFNHTLVITPTSVAFDWPRFSSLNRAVNPLVIRLNRLKDWILSFEYSLYIADVVQSVRRQGMPGISSSNEVVIYERNNDHAGLPVPEKVVAVLPGDSIQKIARRHLGHSKYWRDIVAINGLDIELVTVNQTVVSAVAIFPGQELLMPDI